MRQLVKLPNLLSLSRIPLAIVFLLVFIFDQPKWFGVLIIVIAGITDFLDGWVARRFGSESELGRILDPLGDKIAIVAMSLCVWWWMHFPTTLIVVIVIRELILFILSLYWRKRMTEVPKSHMWGKSSTVLLAAGGVTFILTVPPHMESYPLLIAGISALIISSWIYATRFPFKSLGRKWIAASAYVIVLLVAGVVTFIFFEWESVYSAFKWIH